MPLEQGREGKAGMSTLREKFRGCIAASWVGSAMGAAVEGWEHETVRQKHGLLEKLLPYKHYVDITDWLRARHDRGRHRAPAARRDGDHRDPRPHPRA